MNNRKITQIEGIGVDELISMIDEKITQLFLQKDTTPEEQKDLLTIKEVSELLEVSRVTLHKWDKKGILKPYRIGKKVRYKRLEVLDALNKENE